MTFSQRVEHIFYWLSGASAESLAACPAWERRKYVAFGATVLVPSMFAIIACAYAVSTLTQDWRVILPISLVWAFIILTVDRALLTTYRAYQTTRRKLAQFSLRMVVAVLMGITISHPLSLLLFRDTIQSIIERDRQAEIESARVQSAQQKAGVEARVKTLEAEIAKQREAWNTSFEAKFLDAQGQPVKEPTNSEEQAAKAEREAKIAAASAPGKERLAALDREMAKLSADYQKIAGELNHWQTEFEREVNGQRSGIVGLGPRAKSIMEDQLTWRRAESQRLSGLLDAMTRNRVAVQAEIKAAEDNVSTALAAKAADAAAAAKAERDRVVGLRRQVQQEQADQFVGQQNTLRGALKQHIDTLLAQLTALHAEIDRIGQDAETRIAAIRAEPRRDILTQTLALHRLFKQGSEGGDFALTAYAVLTLLFMLIDTIPLVVKFFSKPGPYDTLLDCDEVRFDGERLAFIRSFEGYMKRMGEGRFMHLTQPNKPLERALIEGVDRSRVAKAFMDHILELERSFEESISAERERVGAGGNPQKLEMLTHVAESFYSDLRSRMEAFFATDGRGSQAVGG